MQSAHPPGPATRRAQQRVVCMKSSVQRLIYKDVPLLYFQLEARVYATTAMTIPSGPSSEHG